MVLMVLGFLDCRPHAADACGSFSRHSARGGGLYREPRHRHCTGRPDAWLTGSARRLPQKQVVCHALMAKTIHRLAFLSAVSVMVSPRMCDLRIEVGSVRAVFWKGRDAPVVVTTGKSHQGHSEA